MNRAQMITLGIAGVIVLMTVLYIKHLQTEVNRLKSDNTELSTKLKIQNDAVLQMKADAEGRLKAAEAELEKAKLASAEHQAKAQVIYKAAPTSDDKCKAALNLMNGGSK